MRAWLRSLNPQLPRAVQMLQLGGLVSAFGNGVVLPFSLIYLHNVRGLSLGVAGLVVGVLGVTALTTGPVWGALVDRHGGRRVMAVALVLLSVGYGSFALVETSIQAFAVALVAGLGNGGFWPAQSALLAGHTPPEKRPVVWSMQRVVMNLGIGLGAVFGGLVATVDRPTTFELIYAIDALTFIAYLVILLLLVPEYRPARPADGPQPRYMEVMRDRAFMGVIGLNTLFVFAGMAGIELFPVYAKNEVAVSETAIGLIFAANTAVIVIAQLPVTKLSEGFRRMRGLALLAIVWAACWLAIPFVGLSLDGVSAAIAFGVVLGIFGLGECIHGAVQGPLVADLAPPQLVGRYMALSALSWQVGFALGPAVGAAVLSQSPSGVWIGAAVLLLVSGALALAFERRLPRHAAITPRSPAVPVA